MRDKDLSRRAWVVPSNDDDIRLGVVNGCGEAQASSRLDEHDSSFVLEIMPDELMRHRVQIDKQDSGGFLTRDGWSIIRRRAAAQYGSFGPDWYRAGIRSRSELCERSIHGGCLPSGGDLELLEQVMDVVLHRRKLDVQQGGDLLIRKAPFYERPYLALARRQRDTRGSETLGGCEPPDVVQKSPGERRRALELLPGSGLDRQDQFLKRVVTADEPNDSFLGAGEQFRTELRSPEGDDTSPGADARTARMVPTSLARATSKRTIADSTRCNSTVASAGVPAFPRTVIPSMPARYRARLSL